MARPTRRPDDSSPKDLHQLGVRGRKTGAVLRNDVPLDQHGMAPLDDIFSSPKSDPPVRPVPGTARKPAPQPAPQRAPQPAPEPELPDQATPGRRADDDGSDAMDIAYSDGPGPGTVIGNRNRRQSELAPSSRSPFKKPGGLFNSPAKRSPHIASIRRSQTPNDSTLKQPSFGAQVGGVQRPAFIGELPSDDTNAPGGSDDDVANLVNQSIQFGSGSGNDHGGVDFRTANEYRPRGPSGTAPVRSAKAQGKQPAAPTRTSPRKPAPPIPSSPPPIDEPGMYVSDDPVPSLSPEPPAPAPLPSSSPQVPIREPTVSRPSIAPPIRKRPTPSLSATGSVRRSRDDEDDEPPAAPKRPRQTASVVSRRSEPPVKRGRGRPPKNGVAKRGRGRPRKSEMESDGEEGESLMTLQRGPPMPKSRGLVSMRRDTTAAPENRSRGRSGNDVEWWADDYEPQLPRAGLTQANVKHRRRPAAAMVNEEEELEDWELDPGTYTGEIVLWEPEHEANPPGPDDPVQVTDELVAWTAEAIEMEGIKESTARFGKPLALPFMGAGIVDLPPNSEKRPKNSRKMHLVFFVHYGKVLVSINDAEFRVSAGSMWFVPRGNYYNITNDYDSPARVYFAQACEVSSSHVDDMTQTMAVDQ